MKNLKNQVRLIGNVGVLPVMKTFENGQSNVRFSLAINETFTDKKGNKQTDTTWHNLVAWGKTAELISKYVEKGAEIAIEGKLSSRSYEDKDGNTRYITEIIVNEFMLLGAKKAAA
jgi:single-strand DNA-binding protein